MKTIATTDLRPGMTLAHHRLDRHMVIVNTRKVFDGRVQVTYKIVRTSTGKIICTFADRFEKHDAWTPINF